MIRSIQIAIILLISCYTSAEVLIAGYPLGGKIATTIDLHQRSGLDQLFPDGKVYLSDQIEFFDVVEIETNENNIIMALAFTKIYKINSFNLQVTRDQVKRDLGELVKTLEKKYGSFETKRARRILGPESDKNIYWLQEMNEILANRAPNHDQISTIAITLQAPGLDVQRPEEDRKITLTLVYVDKSVNIEKDSNQFSDF